MMNYGFCFANNLYDSVKFNVRNPGKELSSGIELISRYETRDCKIILKRD